MVGGEKITEATYEINSPLIQKVGYDYFNKIFIIKYSNGKNHKITYKYEDYLAFINSEDHDKFFIEKLVPLIRKTSSVNIRKGMQISKV